MTARLPTIVTLHDNRFAEGRWRNDGWTVKTRHLTVVGLHDTGPRTLRRITARHPSLNHQNRHETIGQSLIGSNRWDGKESNNTNDNQQRQPTNQSILISGKRFGTVGRREQGHESQAIYVLCIAYSYVPKRHSMENWHLEGDPKAAHSCATRMSARKT